jgi:Gas vesicle protein K
MIAEMEIAPATAPKMEQFAAALTPPTPHASRVVLRPDDVKNGLGRLVLTLVELIRQLLERQAIRRIEAGSLTEDDVERLGMTFLQLSTQMKMLREQFGLAEEDLNLDLGPLGKLL